MTQIRLTTQDARTGQDPHTLTGIDIYDSVVANEPIWAVQGRLPQLGLGRYYKGWPENEAGVVVPFRGRFWRVQYDRGAFDGVRPLGGEVIFTEVKDQKPTNYSPGDRWSWELAFFSQPRFIQGKMFPSHDGKASAFPLFTWENGWGDFGNENVLVSLDDDGRPVAVFHHASCC